MFQNLMKKFEAKRAGWMRETEHRIREYAELERQTALRKMEWEQKQQLLLNEEVRKYLRTVHPSFLLKPEINKALMNMLHARSEGSVSVNINMTKDMRKTYSYYHNELKVFLKLLERNGYEVTGNEEIFLTTFLTQLRDNNFEICMEQYGDFLPTGASLTEAFEHYFEVVEPEMKYDAGKLDFFGIYLKQKGLIDELWSFSRLKKRLKQFEKLNKDEFKLKQLEKRLARIS